MGALRVERADKDPNEQEPDGTRTAYAREDDPGEPYVLVSGSNVTVQLWVRSEDLGWFAAGEPTLCHEQKVNLLERVPRGAKFFAQVCKVPGKPVRLSVGLM